MRKKHLLIYSKISVLMYNSLNETKIIVSGLNYYLFLLGGI